MTLPQNYALCEVLLHHSLPALQMQKLGKNVIYAFAFAYSGWQNVFYLER
jgi:hypothetical protein